MGLTIITVVKPLLTMGINHQQVPQAHSFSTEALCSPRRVGPAMGERELPPGPVARAQQRHRSQELEPGQQPDPKSKAVPVAVPSSRSQQSLVWGGLVMVSGWWF